MRPDSRRFRVLLVSDTYPPVLGGSEVEAQRIAAALNGRGHQVHVLCSGGPPMPSVREWTDAKGTPVTILTQRSRGLAKELVFSGEVASFIWRKRRSFDLVYFLMQGLHLAAGMPAAAAAKLPFTVKIAGSGVIPRMRAARFGRFELDYMQRQNVKLMLLNPGMFEEARTDGFSDEQLVWMPNPVDIDEFRPRRDGEAEAWRRAHGIPENAIAVVYVGRLSHEKGILPLIRGFALAAAREPRAVLLLVGDGALRDTLRAEAAEAGLSDAQIRFVGRVEPGAVPAWLRASDIYALTSPGEGFACALLEAMAAGLPSVVSDIPANRQLVDHGIHGYTVPFGAEEAIGTSLTALFEEEPRRVQMGMEARRKAVDNFSTDCVADLYEDLFASLRPV